MNDLEQQRRNCPPSPLPLSPHLLTEAQRELAGKFGASLLAEFLLQKRKEARGTMFSAYDIPDSCGRIASQGVALGIFATSRWEKVWDSTALTRPWCELAVELERAFNESPEAEAIRKKILTPLGRSTWRNQ